MYTALGKDVDPGVSIAKVGGRSRKGIVVTGGVETGRRGERILEEHVGRRKRLGLG